MAVIRKVFLFSLCCIFIFLPVTLEQQSVCQDHPRLKEACQRLPNLKSWCNSKNKTSGPINNVAEVCKASCGFCKAVEETSASPTTASDQPATPVADSRRTEAATARISSPTGSSTDCDTEPDYKPCVELKEANALFLKCCQDFHVPSQCTDLCKYDVTLGEAETIALGGSCPLSALATHLYCASRNRDNTACCKAKKVMELAGPQCAQFCNPTKDFDTIGKEHLPCTAQLEDVMACHWAGVRKMDGTDTSKR